MSQVSVAGRADETKMNTTAHNTNEAAAGGRPAGRRKSAMVGAAVGAVIAVAGLGYWVYDRAATPARPNVESASVGDVIAFVVNERGLGRLPQYEQERFLAAWKTEYAKDSKHRELKAYLEKAPESERAAVREALYRIARRQFFADAREYLKLKDANENTYPFLAGKLAAAAMEAAWIKGNGDPAKDLSNVMAAGLPRNPEDITKLIVSDTTPEERVLGEQYLNALRNVREQEKKKAGP